MAHANCYSEPVVGEGGTGLRAKGGPVLPWCMPRLLAKAAKHREARSLSAHPPLDFRCRAPLGEHGCDAYRGQAAHTENRCATTSLALCATRPQHITDRPATSGVPADGRVRDERAAL